MNYPAITCFTTGTGLKHEIELIRAFDSMGYIPMVNSIRRPTEKELRESKNTIVYFWMPNETPYNEKISMHIGSAPAEEAPRGFTIAAVQVHTNRLSPVNRQAIGSYFIKRMIGNEPDKATKKIAMLTERGCFSKPVTIKSTEVYNPKHVIIKDGVETVASTLSTEKENDVLKFFNK